MSPLRTRASLALVLAVLVVTTGGHAAAQQAGSVSGQVTAAQTQRPLAGVQVHIPGAGVGSLTNAEGRFLLVNVPVGTHTVRAQLLGFGSAEQSVTVAPGSTTSATFRLQESAIALDEVVVTGTGQATERRKLGNTVESINFAQLDDAPILSPAEALQARTPGITVGTSGGHAGAGAQIRIRGSGSLSQSNDPIIYVDGVRIDAARGFGQANSGSRLDDINPESIERIEILKGAAAATLYGTEASNGVIQIFTKKGRAGEPRWTLSMSGGLSKHPNTIPPLAGFALAETETPLRDRGTRALSEHWGIDLQPYEVFEVDLYDHILETGYHQDYSLATTGGSDAITYHVVGRYALEDGILGAKQYREPGVDILEDLNEYKQVDASISMVPTENLRLELTSRYVDRSQNPIPDSQGPIAISQLSKPEQAHARNEIGRTAFSTVRETMRELYNESTQRYGGALTARYALTPALNFDVTTGLDVVSAVGTFFRPYGWNVDGYSGFTPQGFKEVTNRNHNEVTIDAKANWATNLGSQYTSSFVVGTQTLMSNTQSIRSEGEQFPGPGLEVVGAGAIQRNTENVLRKVNTGAFAQEQVGFRDFLFVTVGARIDRHSAFGEDAEAALYPKASFSLVPSSMESWQGLGPVSTLRFRGAIGQSGLQPGAFDRFTTFRPVTSVQGPGVLPENLGNPAIKPEVSTEWEGGFEVGLLQDRFAIEATYWNRTVDDLLIQRQFTPSGGFLQTQLDNIGQMKAWGVDLDVGGSVYRSPALSIDLFANGAFIREEVTDMGGAPPIRQGGTRELGWVKVGYAPSAMFGGQLIDAEFPFDTNGDGQPDSREQMLQYLSQRRTVEQLEALAMGELAEDGSLEGHYLGKSMPDWSGSFGGSVAFGDFSLATNFQYNGGNYSVQNHKDAFRNGHPGIGRNNPTSAGMDATLMNPASSAEQRLEAAEWFVDHAFALVKFNGLNQVQEADFIRWRELSLTYRVPAAVVGRLGADGVSLTASGRNLLLWTDYPGMDPETSYLGNVQQGFDSHLFGIPRRLSLSARVNF